MNLKRLVWLALLLPQFVFLLLAAYDDLRELRHELQFHAPRVWGCITIAFSTPAFVSGLLGITAVIGLCGLRWWSRWLYAGLAIILFATAWHDFLHPAFGDWSYLCVPGLVFVTSVLCFVPRFQAFQVPPRGLALWSTR